MRRAIALGRLTLDPLAVLAQLSGGAEGSGREVLSIRLTDIQDLLSVDERMAVVEQVGQGGEGNMNSQDVSAICAHLKC